MARGEPATELAIDAGHEFIDVAIRSGTQYRVSKIAVAGRRRSDAVLAAIDVALAGWNTALDTVGAIRFVSTDAVNALLARDGAGIVLMTTQGFGDCLRLGRQNRIDLYNPVARSPAPTFLVTRRNICEIAGRIDANGDEIVPLDEGAIRAAAQGASSTGAQSVAVCFLFAHVNAAHERRCGDIVREEFPGAEICLSHEIDPQPREYERTVSVCLEAWLRPALTRAIQALQDGLRQRGFAGRLLFADGSGALSDADAARGGVSRLIASGPAAAASYAARAAGSARTAIAIDLGSVSLDIALVQNGRPRAVRNATYAGVPLRQDMADVASAELGGRSVVVVNGDGEIAFRSAGTDRGGPTLNDALIQTGRVPAAPGIDSTAALRAFGISLGRSDAADIAAAIVEAAERKVAHCVLDFAARRNIDPVAVPMVAMGGLGAALAPAAAAMLGVKEILAPDHASAGGALGLLLSAPSFRSRAAAGRWTDQLTARQLSDLLSPLADGVRAQAAILGSVGETRFRTEVEIASDALMHPYAITIDGLPADPEALMTAFREQFFAEFGVAPPQRAFVFSLAVVLIGTDGALDDFADAEAAP